MRRSRPTGRDTIRQSFAQGQSFTIDPVVGVKTQKPASARALPEKSEADREREMEDRLRTEAQLHLVRKKNFERRKN